MPDQLRMSRAEPAAPPPRKAYFGTDLGWIETPVLGGRSALRTPIVGPAIVEEYDATLLITPGAEARLDSSDNIVISL